MKTLILSFVIVCLLCGTAAFAQGKGRGQGKSPKDKPDWAGAAEEKQQGRATTEEAEEQMEEAEEQAEEARKRAEEARERAHERREEMKEQSEESMTEERGPSNRGLSDEGDEKGKGPDKREQARERTLENMERAHLKRIAKLQVLRDKLIEKGNENAADRASELIEKENSRYEQQVEKIITEGHEFEGKDEDARGNKDRDKPGRAPEEEGTGRKMKERNNNGHNGKPGKED
ncbi:MAG: hypothetical protein K9N51_10670 [Candidatus Pacebacteria bacterium]|nr:hypothetical protein [Candidatus Paceibacterota bacterium]